MYPPMQFAVRVRRRSVDDGLGPLARLRTRLAELGGQATCRGGDLVAHQCDVLVGRTHHWSRSADRADNGAGPDPDCSADANNARQEFLSIHRLSAPTRNTK